MSDIQEARAELDEAERAFRSIPLWLPPFIFSRRLAKAVARRDAASRDLNVALFDAQVDAMPSLDELAGLYRDHHDHSTETKENG